MRAQTLKLTKIQYCQYWRIEVWLSLKFKLQSWNKKLFEHCNESLFQTMLQYFNDKYLFWLPITIHCTQYFIQHLTNKLVQLHLNTFNSHYSNPSILLGLKSYCKHLQLFNADLQKLMFWTWNLWHFQFSKFIIRSIFPVIILGTPCTYVHVAPYLVQAIQSVHPHSCSQVKEVHF